MATSTRIFSFGLGKSPSRSLVKGLARATNGRFVFIPPNSSVDVYVGEQLQKALQPCLTNVQVKWNLGVDVQNAPKQTPPVYLNDRLIVYALTKDKTVPFDHNASVKLQIEPNHRSIGVARVNQIPNVPENETIARLAAKALILELQHAKLPSASMKKPTTGSIQARFKKWATANKEKKEVVPDEQTTKQYIIELSLKYNILSPHTAFVGIEKRTNASNADMVLREVPIEISADDQHLINPVRKFRKAASGSSVMPKGGLQGAIRHIGNSISFQKKSMRSVPPMACAMIVPQSASLSCNSRPFPKDYYFQSSSPLCSDDDDMDDDMESAINAKKTDVWPSTDQDIVRYLINKQKFDGLWNADDNIIKNLTGKSLSVFQSTTPNISNEILASIVVIIIFETRFVGFSSLWHGVVQKARKRIIDLLKKDSKNFDTLIEDIRKQL
jgi:hypothetical protein